MKVRKLVTMLLVAVCGGVIAVFAYTAIIGRPAGLPVGTTTPPYHLTALESPTIRDVSYPDLTYAAEKAVHCVVHVKIKSTQTRYSGSGNPFYDFFYGPRRERVPVEAFVGSGVIISDDGYIVTNNHVIERADEVEVSLNDKRVLSAKVIGADPNTDLALLKVEESGLPYLEYGDAEALRVGEWVLAVGNPYNLTSTVTAGIVSAKARYLGIITEELGIESFIQTDAAVNPGNSGGALVNTRGELVGINAAIISRTGDYSGNAFAIPVTIVQKVVADLKEFGNVQRALLGVKFYNESERTEDPKIEELRIKSVEENFGAAAAGIREGDVITAINNMPVSTFIEFQVQLSRYRPNDQVEVTAIRDKKTQQFNVTLRNIEGTTQILHGNPSNNIFGAKFEEVSKRDRQNLGINSGVKVKDAGDGKFSAAGIRNGFIITAVNDKPVNSARDMQTIINAVEPKGRILISGVYPNGQVTYYVFVK